ncbi:MAG: serine hydrolase [Chloroflexi bacterium]|nr:serine hydrolase [Chloroflexota bacterium]
MRTRRLLLCLVWCASLVWSVIAPVSHAARASKPSGDYWPTDIWLSTAPEEQGMDSTLLAEMLAFALEEQVNLDSVTVIRNGYVVTDAYFYPFNQGDRHNLYSVTKSFTATLVGIAIDQGYIADVDVPLVEFFPAREIANLDAAKRAITLRDLLTMSAGLTCDDADFFTLGQMRRSPDFVQFMLDLPMSDTPGTRFNYCNGVSHLLSAIVQEATGQPLLAYAEQNLFGPLGITRPLWSQDPQGYTTGWSDLQLTPHDMARLGYLYLRSGQWDDEQIVSADWVTAATTAQLSTGQGGGYGYQWWVPSDRMYMAAGYQGQYIFVVPSLDLVVVFTSSLGIDAGQYPFLLLEQYIIPAGESDEPLPPNPGALVRLNNLTLASASPVPPLPPVAHTISGKVLLLDDNLLDWRSLTLIFETGAEEALLIVNGGALVPVGLGGASRVTPARQVGGPATNEAVLQGRWVDEQTFVLEYNLLIGTDGYQLEMVFSPDGSATITIYSRGSGQVETVIALVQ